MKISYGVTPVNWTGTFVIGSAWEREISTRVVKPSGPTTTTNAASPLLYLAGFRGSCLELGKDPLGYT